MIDLRGKVLKSTVSTGDWPPEFALEPLAIAQHHGVPTRLLDFSYLPQVAAFFAAWDAEKHRQHGQLAKTARFAVWAVNLDFIRRCWGPDNHRMCVVYAPRGPNAFLHAQHGLFFYDRHANGTWTGSPVPFEDVITGGATSRQYTDPVVFKFTAPVGSARTVLRELAKDGLDLASVMPTLRTLRLKPRHTGMTNGSSRACRSRPGGPSA